MAQPSPAPSSPAARRITTPKWLDLRLVLGVVLVLASVLIGAKIVSSARHTYPTVAATHDLAAGTVLAASDLKLAHVQLPDRGKGVYLSRLTDAVGKQLNRPVSAGELVPLRAVGAVPVRTTVTVPLATGAAPDLRKGQRIEVWLSTPACGSVVLLPDVSVQAVHADSGGSFDSGTGGQDVVISVEPALADRVVAALAIDQAKLRAGVLVGHAPAAGALPDLATCSTTPGTGATSGATPSR
ncbi:MAG TPA: SAF domain-containing protein [Jatrophihabitans sp.]|nr:SAF domain-containing protein [Jatrophihabitans sp.]